MEVRGDVVMLMGGSVFLVHHSLNIQLPLLPPAAWRRFLLQEDAWGLFFEYPHPFTLFLCLFTIHLNYSAK